MKGSKLGIRLLYYFGGFFVMTIGIALSVKSNLGVSPVSSIPYTMTCVWGIEMGVATVIFHVILVILQMLLMRRRFECKNLLQIPVGMVFGAFTWANRPAHICFFVFSGFCSPIKTPPF